MKGTAQLLEQLTSRATNAFGNRLVAVILYGSGASDDYDGDYSDLNILCVLTKVTTTELRDSERVFHWWRELGNPSPLLLSDEEVRTSTDCFPIEFHDMKERRRLLAGTDIIVEIEVDDSFYRAQVEHELRAKLLRLRQKAAGVIHDRELLCRLLVESVSTFIMLLRHALKIAGHPAPIERLYIVDEAERKFSINPHPFLTLLALRNKKIRAKDTDAAVLLEQYIAQISKVIGAVDILEKR
ncbi:MAG TPA: hypothetical protein VM120_11570 [Bryobacteraceae bacterium]|nr:hypothetical protein [Bryobacteraceae bacterium]